MKGAKAFQLLTELGAVVVKEASAEGKQPQVVRGFYRHTEDREVTRKSGGTVMERHVVDTPWYSVYAHGDLALHFTEDTDVPESEVVRVMELGSPLPHQAMHQLVSPAYTCIGIVGMKDSPYAVQLARVDIKDGRVTSVVPLMGAERETDAVAFARLQSMIPLVASRWGVGDFRGVPFKEPSDETAAQQEKAEASHA